MSDSNFIGSLDAWFEEWCAARPQGSEGLQSFTDGVYEHAARYLKSHCIQATSAIHRLEVAVSALQVLHALPLDERRLAGLCQLDPDLQDVIEVEVSLDDRTSTARPDVLHRVQQRCSEQADLVAADAVDMELGPQSSGTALRYHRETQES